MLRFATILDPKIIKDTITNPKLWLWVAEASSPAPEDLEPVMEVSIREHVGVWVDAQYYGLFALDFCSTNIIKIHTCLLPSAWGNSSFFAKGILRHIWETYPKVTQVVTEIPSNNRLALRLALTAGMQQYGKLLSSWTALNGETMDLIFMQIAKPDNI